MEDSSEDLPTPPRRAAARPFFSPRPEGVTGPLELSRRRAAQLFTPPGSSPAAPSASAQQAAIPERSLEAPPTLDVESLAHRNTMDDGDQLYVEQFEHEEIELTSASATTVPDEHSIEVIAYDDANSLLKAAATEGERPQVDGLRIETTEFSFHRDAREEPAEPGESFWATEPFGAAAASAPVHSTSEAHEAHEAREEREVEHAEMALDDAETESHASHPLEWGNVDTMRADSEPRFADSRPPWVGRPTPASSQSLEELKEEEPWAVSPALGELPIVEPEIAAPEADVAADSALAYDEPPMDERFTQERAIAAPPSHPVADALERIAARVRAGGLDVPPRSESSDAASLAAVLTALLRQPR